MTNKLYSVNEMIERYATKDNGRYCGYGIKETFDVLNGMSLELKFLMRSLLNGNNTEEDFDCLELIFENKRGAHLLICSCGKTSSTGREDGACECGNKNRVTIYLEEGEQSLLGRSVYKLSESDDMMDYIIFNHYIRYDYGKLEIEILSPIYLQMHSNKLVISEDYIHRDDDLYNIDLDKGYLLDEYDLDKCTAFWADRYKYNNQAVGSNVFFNALKLKFGIDINFDCEELSSALQYIHFALRNQDTLFDCSDDNEVIHSLNRTIVKNIKEYYTSYYGHSKDTIEIIEKAKKLKNLLGENKLEDILEQANLFIQEDNHIKNDISSISAIVEFVLNVKDSDIEGYLSTFLKKHDTLLTLYHTERFLDMYNGIKSSGKEVSFNELVKYITRYIDNEGKKISDAISELAQVYSHIDKFKGAFSFSIYNNCMLRMRLGEDRYNFIEELSKCNSFDSLYKKVIS